MKCTWLYGCTLLLAAALVVGGCSKDSGGPPQEEKQAETPVNPIYNNEPLTIKLAIAASQSEQIFQTQFAEPVKKKFPHVTLERQSMNDLSKLVVAGDIPDIVKITTSRMNEMFELGLEYDLRDLLKKYSESIDRFIPEIGDSIRSYGSNGEIYGFPWQNTLYGLIYNKDIFNRFGASYPKDGMTWEEAIQLAHRLSRIDGGVAYRGLEVQEPLQLYAQLSLNPFPSGNNTMVITTPKWQTAATLYRNIYTIPGNYSADTWKAGTGYTELFEGRLGMLAISMIRMISDAAQYPDLNWDVVTYPSYSEAAGVDPNLSYEFLYVTSTGKHKEESFAIISHLVSDKVQTALSRSGFITPLRDPAIQRQLGAELNVLREKDLAKLFKHRQTNYVWNKYDNWSWLRDNAFKPIRDGGKDINTALREAEEARNKEIAALDK